MFTRDVYLDNKAPSYALLVVTLKAFGMEALEWEPELLRQEIDREYDIKLSDLQHDKLHAMVVCMVTDHFEHDWRVFETCVSLFNGESVDHEDLNPLEAEEIAVGLAEFMLLKKDVDIGPTHFGEEVRAYAGIIFYEYGMHHSPKIFPTAIMPKSVNQDDAINDEKNEALKEIFDTHVQYVLDYLEKLD